MKQSILTIYAVACLIVLVPATFTCAWAVEPTVANHGELQESGESAERQPVSSLTTMSDAQAERLSPLNREMREILLLESVDVEVLATRMAGLSDRVAALELQREISDRKFQTQIDLLEVQGRYARQEGHIEQAEEAESAVTQLKARRDSRRIERGDG